MSTDAKENQALKELSFPLYRTAVRMAMGPVQEFERIASVADGRIAELDLGALRPLLITHPDHVRHVLRDNQDNYSRDGVFWDPLRRIFGSASVLSEGGGWDHSRRTLQPLFTSRNVGALGQQMADCINQAIEQLPLNTPLHANTAMADIIHKTIIRVFFGGKVSVEEAEKLGPAFEGVATSLAWRILMPFVPDGFPLPGDLQFRRSMKIIDEVIYSMVERYRNDPDDGDDIFTALCRARKADGGELSDTWFRDNIVAIFAAGVETATVSFSWLWATLQNHPEVTERLYAEIDRVVGGGGVRPEHVRELVYTDQVVQEILRLHPPGWLFPRIALEDDVVGGYRIPKGKSILISPYLTHRLGSVWDRPLEFDPDRFAPGKERDRHRYAYFPFGGGGHQCIGRHVYGMEAVMILASLLSRRRFEVLDLEPLRVKMGASLRPKQDLTMIVREYQPK